MECMGARNHGAQFVSACHAMTVEQQITSFLEKYDPRISCVLSVVRAHLRAKVPRGYELVYDNYNALVFAFGSSERASDIVMSVAGYPQWVTLFFADGNVLKDPNQLLQGDGKKIRGIRLSDDVTLDRPEVLAIIAQVMAPMAAKLDAAPPLTTIIKSVSAKQRSRRPKAKP